MNANDASRSGILAAILIIAGVLLSGPLSAISVAIVHPSPAWQDAATFAAAYHPVQTAPAFGGFLLIFGCAFLIAALYGLADDEHRTAALFAVMCTSAFVALIFFNYLCQTTFVPALARDYRPEYAPIISTFSLSNPHSLSWAIEMWGYALFGLATWLVAPVFDRNRIERVAAGLLIANGILSIAGGFVTAADLGWVFSTAGLACYAVWNVVVLLMAGFILASLLRRSAERPLVVPHAA